MERECPRCKTNSYQNPKLRLMVNICGHKLNKTSVKCPCLLSECSCEACIDSVFTRPSAPCPECGVALRRNQFRQQQFDDSHVEKEVDIRKKILKDYNKTEKDFSSLREYNDYLEEVETIIFNLSNGVDVEETKRKVNHYKKENQTMILKNRERQLRTEHLRSTQLEQERLEKELRNKEAQALEEEIAKQKRREKESILDELMYSDRPASEVLASAAASAEQAKTADQAISKPSVRKGPAQVLPSHHGLMGTAIFDYVPVETGTTYSYKPPIVTTYGPGVPDLEELEGYGYLSMLGSLEDHHMGAGFVPAYACQRALQEAFSCLLYFKGDKKQS